MGWGNSNSISACNASGVRIPNPRVSLFPDSYLRMRVLRWCLWPFENRKHWRKKGERWKSEGGEGGNDLIVADSRTCGNVKTRWNIVPRDCVVLHFVQLVNNRISSYFYRFNDIHVRRIVLMCETLCCRLFSWIVQIFLEEVRLSTMYLRLPHLLDSFPGTVLSPHWYDNIDKFGSFNRLNNCQCRKYYQLFFSNPFRSLSSKKN